MRVAAALIALLVSCSPGAPSDTDATQGSSAVDADTSTAESVSTTSADPAPVLRRRVAIFMEATPAALDSVRATYSEEDFAVVADDMMYYRATAYDYLEQHGVDVVRAEGRIPAQFEVRGEARAFDFSNEPYLDLIVLYEPGKQPLAIAPVDIDRAADYFGLGSGQ
ncbi:MAG: hypothetical protein ACYC28_10395 [Longimicrobiales bacterium]